MIALRRPLERRVRLGTNAPIDTVHRMSRCLDTAPDVDDLLGQVRNREHVLVGSPHMK